jgi:hypothetical protein
MNLSECRNQAWAGREAKIHKASFTERRLFYLNCTLIPNPSPGGEGSSPLSLWDAIAARVREYEGMQ